MWNFTNAENLPLFYFKLCCIPINLYFLNTWGQFYLIYFKMTINLLLINH